MNTMNLIGHTPRFVDINNINNKGNENRER